ncbi:hypothetical protein CDD82_362 [Ophiocordyceps australis]|uniref:Trichodiene oxygenase n=1 Tax=Ophiocordyceps australis TaxID=1399860 RepID=A0A2C5ZP55_9HYPO|nr:hypothetical protein CDD82_362 [Ophiocordyceps australis]
MDLSQVLSWKNVAGAFAVYWVTRAFYRLFFHPLANFPGPKLAAITLWYEAYYDLIQKGQYTFRIAEMHKTYGPIVRISPSELHVIDPAFHEKLYCQSGRWNKYKWSYDAFGAEGSTFSAALHELHQARRVPLNYFFSKARVAARDDVIVRNVDKLCARILERVGSTINLGAAVSALSQDVACEFVLDKTYGSLDRDDFNVAVTDMVQNTNWIWRITKHFPWFSPAMKAIPLGLISKMTNEGTLSFFQFLQGIEKQAENRFKLATSSPEKDRTPTLVDEIVDSNLPLPEKAFPRLLPDVQTIVGAGFETASSVMRLMLYHVFANPDILQRLRTELATISTASSVSGVLGFKELEQLPYLTSVIMEALRMSPGLGSRLARIAPDRAIFYEDWCIPAGTPVGMTAILMHNDETLYPNPRSFNPDRWDMPGRRRLNATFAPFSKGTRICLGMHLAWAELYITLAAIVQRFNFDFQGVQATDFEMESDEFIIGTRAKTPFEGHVTLYEN